MNSKNNLSEFARRAMQRLQDKKTPKKATLYIPSLNEDITIRNLSHAEITECVEMDEDGGERSDKYCVYLATVDPDLRSAAKEIMEAESDLPGAEKSLLEPLDIVEMFEMSEIQQIAMEVMKLSGVLNDKKVVLVENLKN